MKDTLDKIMDILFMAACIYPYFSLINLRKISYISDELHRVNEKLERIADVLERKEE